MRLSFRLTVGESCFRLSTILLTFAFPVDRTDGLVEEDILEGSLEDVLDDDGQDGHSSRSRVVVGHTYGEVGRHTHGGEGRVVVLDA